MRVSSLLFSVLAASVVANYLDANHWTSNDIKQFLHDRNVEFDKHADEKQLIEKANAELEKLKNRDTIFVDVNDKSNQKILDLATDPHANLNDQLPFHNWDYLFSDNHDGAGEKIQDWIFESWSLDSLKRFAKQNKVKLDNKTPTKQDVIDSIKKNYQKIADSNHASGLYPGDWLYSTWNLESLKKWLTSFDIEFDPKATKENLVDLVKQNNYFASSSNKDSKQSLLDSLNLLNKDIFDSAGKIKDEAFDSWSYSQLREWLYYNGIIDTKPDVYREDLTPDKIKQMAHTYEHYLSSDIKNWYENAKKSASPFIGKGSASNDWLSNETFLLGINKWSKERLQDFLKARDVKFSRFTPKKNLIELVQKHKNSPVVNKSSFNWLVGGLSTDSFKNWLQEQGQNIEGTRQDLLNTIQDYVGHAKPNSFKSQAKLYKPDIQQYRDYLINNAKISKQKVDELNDEAIKATYKVASDYYDEASKAIESKYDSTKSSLDNTLQEIQDAAYEYSAQFVADYEHSKDKVNSQIEETKKAANEWSQYFIDSVNDAFENTAKPAATAAVQDANNYFMGLLQNFKNAILHGKSSAEDKLSEYSSTLSDEFEAGKKDAQLKAEQVASDVKAKGQEAASVVGEKVDEYGKAAHAKGQEYGEAAHAKGQEYAADIKKQAEELKKAGEGYAAEAGSRAEDAAKAAYAKGQEYAAEAGSKAEDARKAAYAKGQEYAQEAGSKAEDARKAAHAKGQEYVQEAKSAGDQAAKNIKNAAKNVASNTYETVQGGWNYLLDSFGNVDLITYLQSFGFDHAWLAKLNRRQLKILAHEQSKIFYGEKPAWDKSIKDVLVDTSADIQKKLGFKQETYWDKIKALL